MFFPRKSYPEIISLHIPKTAGTSFRNILKSTYGDDLVARFDIDSKDIVRLNGEIYEKNELPRAKVIHGHFIFELLKSKFTLPEEYKLITWLRDPVKRVISNFNYLESRLKEILDEDRMNLNILSKMQRTLIEYARADINRNRQVKFLTGSKFEDFDFIGIQEFFDEDIIRLSKVLGWKKIPEVLHHNKTPETRSPVTDEIIQEIRELNSEDIELYQGAIKLRNMKINDKA